MKQYFKTNILSHSNIMITKISHKDLNILNSILFKKTNYSGVRYNQHILWRWDWKLGVWSTVVSTSDKVSLLSELTYLFDIENIFCFSGWSDTWTIFNYSTQHKFWNHMFDKHLDTILQDCSITDVLLYIFSVSNNRHYNYKSNAFKRRMSIFFNKYPLIFKYKRRHFYWINTIQYYTNKYSNILKTRVKQFFYNYYVPNSTNFYVHNINYKNYFYTYRRKEFIKRIKSNSIQKQKRPHFYKGKNGFWYQRNYKWYYVYKKRDSGYEKYDCYIDSKLGTKDSHLHQPNTQLEHYMKSTYSPDPSMSADWSQNLFKMKIFTKRQHIYRFYKYNKYTRFTRGSIRRIQSKRYRGNKITNRIRKYQNKNKKFNMLNLAKSNKLHKHDTYSYIRFINQNPHHKSFHSEYKSMYLNRWNNNIEYIKFLLLQPKQKRDAPISESRDKVTSLHSRILDMSNFIKKKGWSIHVPIRIYFQRYIDMNIPEHRFVIKANVHSIFNDYETNIYSNNNKLPFKKYYVKSMLYNRKVSKRDTIPIPDRVYENTPISLIKSYIAFEKYRTDKLASLWYSKYDITNPHNRYTDNSNTNRKVNMFNVSGDNVSHYSYINKNLYNRYSNLYDHQYKKMSYNTFKKGNLSNRYNLVAYDNLYNIHLSNINKSNITSVISKSNYTSSALSIAHHYSKRKKSKYVTKIDFYIPNRLISIYNLYNKKIVKSIRNLLKHELKVKYWFNLNNEKRTMNKYHQNNIQTYFINSNQEYMYMYDKYKLSSYVSSYSTDIFNRPVVRLSTKREVRETNLFYLYLYNRDKNKKDNSIQINVLYKYLFNMNNFKLTHDPIYKIEELFYQLDKNKVNLHKTIFEIKAASKLPRHQLYFYKKKLYTTLLFESVGFKNFSILQNSELFYNKDITNKYWRFIKQQYPKDLKLFIRDNWFRTKNNNRRMHFYLYQVSQLKQFNDCFFVIQKFMYWYSLFNTKNRNSILYQSIRYNSYKKMYDFCFYTNYINVLSLLNSYELNIHNKYSGEYYFNDGKTGIYTALVMDRQVFETYSSFSYFFINNVNTNRLYNYYIKKKLDLLKREQLTSTKNYLFTNYVVDTSKNYHTTIFNNYKNINVLDNKYNTLLRTKTNTIWTNNLKHSFNNDNSLWTKDNSKSVLNMYFNLFYFNHIYTILYNYLNLYHHTNITNNISDIHFCNKITKYNIFIFNNNKYNFFKEFIYILLTSITYKQNITSKIGFNCFNEFDLVSVMTDYLQTVSKSTVSNYSSISYVFHKVNNTQKKNLFAAISKMLNKKSSVWLSKQLLYHYNTKQFRQYVTKNDSHETVYGADLHTTKESIATKYVIPNYEIRNKWTIDPHDLVQKRTTYENIIHWMEDPYNYKKLASYVKAKAKATNTVRIEKLYSYKTVHNTFKRNILHIIEAVLSIYKIPYVIKSSCFYNVENLYNIKRKTKNITKAAYNFKIAKKKVLSKLNYYCNSLVNSDLYEDYSKIYFSTLIKPTKSIKQDILIKNTNEIMSYYTNNMNIRTNLVFIMISELFKIKKRIILTISENTKKHDYLKLVNGILSTYRMLKYCFLKENYYDNIIDKNKQKKGVTQTFTKSNIKSNTIFYNRNRNRNWYSKLTNHKFYYEIINFKNKLLCVYGTFKCSILYENLGESISKKSSRVIVTNYNDLSSFFYSHCTVDQLFNIEIKDVFSFYK